MLMAARAAEESFDDTYARTVCGGGTRPTDDTVAALCLEISGVGRWYTAEVRRLGVAEGAMVEPGHERYAEVRSLGTEVDLRAQEIMVLLARARGDARALKRRPPPEPFLFYFLCMQEPAVRGRARFLSRLVTP